MRKPDRIRSVLEYYLGEKLPEGWTIERGEEFHAMQNAQGRISFRQRDEIKRIRAGNAVFLLGLENQNTVNLILPLRLMEMDCLTYRAGVEEIQERNRKEKVRYGGRDDFKYRYRRTDKLEPVLNLTLYWGKEEWTGPLSLGDMMDRKGIPYRLWDLFGDYRIHLIPMREIPDEELQRMDSDLKYVLGIMKCAGSRKRYIDYINRNSEFFGRIPRSALDVIDACAGIGGIRERLEFRMNEASGEEEADMCKAVRDIERYAEKRGRREGMKEGMKEGIELGSFKMLCSLVDDGILQPSEAAGRMNWSEAVFKKKMRTAGYGLRKRMQQDSL